MSDLTSLNCPSCGASLEYDGRSETIRCSYCDSTIIVPDSLKSSNVRQGVMGDEVPEIGASIHDILILVQNGRKIEAVKLYRETFGVGLKEAKEAVDHLDHGEPTVIHISATDVGKATAASSGCSCLFPIVLLTMVAIGALVFFWIRAPEQGQAILDSVLSGDFETAAESIESASSSVLLNRQPFNEVVATTQGGDGLPPDLLLENWQYGGSEIPILVSYTEANAENGRRAIRWEQQVATTDNTQSFNFGFDNQNVYITMENVLHAYGRSAGEQLWQINLSDQVTRLCQHCIRAQDGVVVVFTDDNQLHAVDATSGQQLWQARLENDNYLYVDDGQFTFAFIDGNVAVLDQIDIEERLTTVLSLYDLQTGELVNHLNPECPDPDGFFSNDSLTRDGQVFINESTDALYFVFGSGMVDTLCMQVWDVTLGEMIWGSRLPEETTLPFFAKSGITTLDSRSPYFIFSAESLVMAVDTSDSKDGILEIDLTTGETIMQFADEEFELAPVGQHNGTVVVLATNTRGSGRTEVWGIDAATAVPAWQHPIRGEDALDIHVTPDGVHIIQILVSGEQQLLVQNLNPINGDLIYETSSQLFAGQYTSREGVSWMPDFAYITADSLLEVDLADGTVTAVWP